MSSVDFRRDDLFSRSSSTSSANASLDESADEELIELVLTMAKPSHRGLQNYQKIPWNYIDDAVI